jgi:hypothetical protein
VKDSAVEVTIPNVLAEIFAGYRCFFVKQFDANVAVIGFNRDHNISLCLASVKDGRLFTILARHCHAWLSSKVIMTPDIAPAGRAENIGDIACLIGAVFQHQPTSLGKDSY